jgi:hypothetical protein
MDRSRQDACTVSHVTHARDRKLQRTKTVSVLEDPIVGCGGGMDEETKKIPIPRYRLCWGDDVAIL